MVQKKFDKNRELPGEVITNWKDPSATVKFKNLTVLSYVIAYESSKKLAEQSFNGRPNFAYIIRNFADIRG